jgi:hypothetical protein
MMTLASMHRQHRATRLPERSATRWSRRVGGDQSCFQQRGADCLPKEPTIGNSENKLCFLYYEYDTGVLRAVGCCVNECGRSAVRLQRANRSVIYRKLSGRLRALPVRSKLKKLLCGARIKQARRAAADRVATRKQNRAQSVQDLLNPHSSGIPVKWTRR